MNKAYKSIYNESTGTFVAVAENVQSRCNQTQLKRAQAAGDLATLKDAGRRVAHVALADLP